MLSFGCNGGRSSTLGGSARPGSTINNTVESAKRKAKGLVKLDICPVGIGTKSSNN